MFESGYSLGLSAMVKAGLICLAATATELSPISYPPVGVVKRALFRSGMSALGTLSLPKVDGSDKGNGNDEVGSGICSSGGVPIDDILDRGARINVDGVADHIRATDALVRGSIIGGGGSGVNIGNGIRNCGNGYDVGKTEDSGGVVVHDLSTIVTRVSNLLCISGRQGAKVSPLSLLSLPINLFSALRLSAMVKAGLICLAATATELSPISYPPVGVVKRALFRSGMSASGTLSLPKVDGSDKGNGNDEVGSGICSSGGVPIDDILDRGARINVDGVADHIRATDALVRGSIIGGGGSGVNIGNGIRNCGNGYDVGKTEDSGGV
nr:hypothetical protein [Tanacetum cinerariifolium]